MTLPVTALFQLRTSSSDSVVLLAVEYPQDSQEQIDDIQVERDSGGNLLFNVVVSHHELCIDQYIATEDQGSNGSVNKLHLAIGWEKGGHETKEYDCPETTEEVRHPRCEVILGLACEQRQCNKDAGRQDQRLEDYLCIVEGHDDGDAICFEDREA